MAVSADDATIDPSAARAFFRHRTGADSRMIWYATEPRTPSDDTRITERPSAHPALDILDFSHVALAVDGTANPHYGQGGTYLNCLHYADNEAAWWDCRDPTAAAYQGEISPANTARAERDGRLLRRLTYNPDFEAMTAAIFDFLAPIGSRLA